MELSSTLPGPISPTHVLKKSEGQMPTTLASLKNKSKLNSNGMRTLIQAISKSFAFLSVVKPIPRKVIDAGRLCDLFRIVASSHLLGNRISD